jgi:hypothetical protein
MDRRAKKLEKARKRRQAVKKRERARTEALAREGGPLVRSAARAAFGPCWLSADWDNAEEPALVTAVVTRRLGDGRLLPATALVDRTCLGVKDGFIAEPLRPSEVDEFLEKVGIPHGGMVECEPGVVQSVVFHAIDYALRLGFTPHRDFPAALFGPRPEALEPTPWHAAERPIYFSGPHDNVNAILARLAAAVGESGFDVIDAGLVYDDGDLDEEDDWPELEPDLPVEGSR